MATLPYHRRGNRSGAPASGRPGPGPPQRWDRPVGRWPAPGRQSGKASRPEHHRGIRQRRLPTPNIFIICLRLEPIYPVF